MNAEIEQILTELQEYFDEKEDAEWDYEQQRFKPSNEMKLSIRLEILKELLSNEKTKLCREQRRLCMKEYMKGIDEENSIAMDILNAPEPELEYESKKTN